MSVPATTYALLGSGEFLPWSEEVDRAVLAAARPAVEGAARMLIVPAASAPEGDEVFDRWGRMGLEHFGRLGIAAEVLPLRTREEALDPARVDPLGRASAVYLSGGNPAYLAHILGDTPAWSRILEELGRGLGFIGCSAGVAFLGDITPDSSVRDFSKPEAWAPGLGLFSRTAFGPHWDKLDTYIPGLEEAVRASVPAHLDLVAIDEETAMVGDGSSWRVLGAGAATVAPGGRRESQVVHPSGERFDWRPRTD